MMKSGQLPPQGDATEADVILNKTFTSAGSFAKKTGVIPDNRGQIVVASEAFAQDTTSGIIHVSPPVGSAVYDDSTVINITDADFIPSNLRHSASIYNLDGNFTGDATATAADMVLGKTAGIKGAMVTGTRVANPISVVSTTATWFGAGTSAISATPVFDLTTVGFETVVGVSIYVGGLFWSGGDPNGVYDLVSFYVSETQKEKTVIVTSPISTTATFEITGFTYDSGTKQLSVNVSFSGTDGTNVSPDSQPQTFTVMAVGY